ncbi:hypothetical protein NUSPORA_02283 [Nucleospora cyclopteri]
MENQTEKERLMNVCFGMFTTATCFLTYKNILNVITINNNYYFAMTCTRYLNIVDFIFVITFFGSTLIYTSQNAFTIDNIEMFSIKTFLAQMFFILMIVNVFIEREKVL